MPRKPQLLPAGVRLSDKLAFAQLHKYFPLSAVKHALETTQKQTQRVRELPNEFMTYYPMALCLYREVSQQEVLNILADGLHWMFGLTDFKVTGKSGISQARSRIGFEPLANIFSICATPLAKPGFEGCFWQGLRLTAIDGTEFEVEDCQTNSDYFGRPSNQNGPAAYPQARAVALIELGTHAPFAAAVGRHTDSEQALAIEVIPYLEAGMLCLADRNFMSWEIFDQSMKMGAELLFRARDDRNLPVQERLPDGSYLSVICSSADRKGLNPITVRVVEYDAMISIEGKSKRQSYRLVTTLLDYRTAKYNDLVTLYRERWEFENSLDEAKTHLLNGKPLRSKTPELTIQEIYGLFMAHYTIRALMYEAAESAQIDPDRLSFTHARNVVERHLPKFGSFSPSAIV